MDELEESLVPVEEDQLPQGVLDLLAMLMLRHRPMAAAGSREPLLLAVPAKGEGPDIHLPRRHAQPVALDQRSAPLFSALLQRPAPSRVEFVAPIIEKLATRVARVEVPLSVIDQALRLPALSSPERPLISVEPLSVDRPSPSIELETPVSDLELHAGQSNVQVARNAPPVALPVAAQILTPPPMPPPEVTLEDVAGSSRDFLQIPFNKGTVSGQVTIARMPGESTQNLVLSPSSAQIFEQLEAPFERAQEPGWRLTDSGDEQQHHGSRQTPDDDESEQPEHLA
ncbi:SpaN/EivJ family type III secretion system needle length determinant [Pseudomonas sp. RIT-PI-q]|uniref:SpaN/EivJ family type III secretion system needle length determinant n=1 Tax=Pseudomonas sp. RIT-PI-q TaxID=1690247 RepID=UPI00128EA334|nr:invasion protein [Pseudomonas sp. RIT-PI-q]